MIHSASDIKLLTRTEKAVRRAEKMFADPVRRKQFQPDTRYIFSSSAPRHSVYKATPIPGFASFLASLDLDRNLSFADLGSGLGSACFAASFVYNKAVGFELDQRLFEAAKRIRQENGIKNVSFKNTDFLSQNLEQFGIIYIFHPFDEIKNAGAASGNFHIGKRLST